MRTYGAPINTVTVRKMGSGNSCRTSNGKRPELGRTGRLCSPVRTRAVTAHADESDDDDACHDQDAVRRVQMGDDPRTFRRKVMNDMHANAPGIDLKKTRSSQLYLTDFRKLAVAEIRKVSAGRRSGESASVRGCSPSCRGRA